MKRAAAVAAGLLTLVISDLHARADAGWRAHEGLDLTVRRVPSVVPRSLSMRADESPDDTAVDPEAGTSGAPAAPSNRTPPKNRGLLDFPDEIADVSEQVTLRLSLGLGLDGGQPSGAPLATGQPLGDSYEPLRVYTFGDAVIGTRGLLVPSLTSYFASQFRFENKDPPPSSAVPSVYDSTRNDAGLLIRSGYVELHETFQNRWLRPLFIKAGRQFRYGPAIAHFDGITIGYDTPALSAGAFLGERVDLYGLRGSNIASLDNRTISGANAHLNLFYLRGLPLALSIDTLNYDGTANLGMGLSLRLSAGTVLRVRVRTRGDALARENVALRARLSKVTTLHIALDNRHALDWAYDLVAGEPSYGAEDPRRFLAFGIPLPRARLSVRAGTVLFDNIDLLVRGAAAHEDSDNSRPSSLAASYAELGAAIEVRFRRSVRLGGSLLYRRYWRDELTPADTRVDTEPDSLAPFTGALGERTFWEADGTARYVLGARNFIAQAQVYGRRYGAPTPYDITDDTGAKVDPSDVRIGTRLSVEAWAAERLRLKGEYDTVFAPSFLAPEIRGEKSLRVVLEGSF